METITESRKHYDEPFKHAAVHFLQSSGKTLVAAAAELGVRPADLRSWQRKYAPASRQKTSRPLNPVAKLRAENEVLRTEILNLKVQWDVLKTTLGIMSTSISNRQNAG